MDDPTRIPIFAVAGGAATLTVAKITDYANIRSATLEAQLAKIPEFTVDAMERANEMASTVAVPSLITGVLYGAVTAFSVAAAMYRIPKYKKK